MKKNDNYNILKIFYNLDENKPLYTDNIEISCISDIPDLFNFEIIINNESSYLTSILPLGGTHILWDFLENICKSNFPVDMNYGLEGPTQYFFALKTNDKQFIRFISISNSWFIPIKETNKKIEIQQIFPTYDYTVHFDVLINKKQLILEFYKELFALFYGRQIPKYDSVGQEVITKSEIIREYFKELSDEKLLSLKNKKSQNVSELKVNFCYP